MPKTQKRASAPPEKVGQQLARYRSMRDFKATAEPRGEAGGKKPREAGELLFVVQKHAARQLHYDFRLSWDGVLKSWAVAKGPSYFPGHKRLAVHVEDHPLEYGNFEGTIPKGQYGGGAVMVWDTGTWKPLGDAGKGLNEGHLKFELQGKKLKGTWALVRMHGWADRSGRDNWLLIKEKDEFARGEEDAAIVEEAPNSAVTGRTIDQIANSNGRVWNSSREKSQETEKPVLSAGGVLKNSSGKVEKQSQKLRSTLKTLPEERFPGFISPQLAQTAASPPNGDGWVYEIKLDGYRIQIHIRSAMSRGQGKKEARLFTRKGLDWSDRMPDIARAARDLSVANAIVDGEAVVLDEKGLSNFAALQAAFQEETRREITYFAFDLLHLDGHNLRNCSLVERKKLLAELLEPLKGRGGPIRYSEHLQAEGNEVFKKACTLGAEGVIAKVGSGQYVSGRGNLWLKLKCIQQQELVIGGFTPPSKGGIGVGALLLGYYSDGKLRYAGRTGTGFTQHTHRMLRGKLDALHQKACPFAEIPREARRNAIWVKPQLVAQVAFTTWTRDNLVRQAAFKGLREDKPAEEVVREIGVAKDKAADQNASSGTKRTASKLERRSGRQSGRDSISMSELPITHPDKVLDEESGLTKRMLAEYYLAVANHMLPHVADRPLSVVRCPEGSEKPCFFQKHVGQGPPKGVGSVSVKSRKSGKTDAYLTVDSAEGLVGLAQMGVLEIHPWGSKNESLERPDRMVIDLDPDAAIEWKTLAQAAKDVQRMLKQMHLESFLKSTGGKGLHVVVPIDPELEWPVVKDFAHNLVLEMEKQQPELYVTKMTKASRKNRIYLDYLRNDRDATSIAPFSPRARRGAPVSVPLRWSELNSEKMPHFFLTGFGEWRARLRNDPWKALTTIRQRLPVDAFRKPSGSRAKAR